MVSERTLAFFSLVTAASTALRSPTQWLQSRSLHLRILIQDTLAPELISFFPSLPACSSAPSAVTIVLAVIGSVVLIGIILLGLWKLLVTIHDRREFDRFQSERSRARYEMVSPGWGCCWPTGGLSGCKQLCSDGEGRQAQGMGVPMLCSALQLGFKDQYVVQPFLLADYRYSAKLCPSCISHECWRAEGGGGVGTKQVYEGALLRGFRWGCPALEGITCACRQVWRTNYGLLLDLSAHFSQSQMQRYLQI